MPVWAGCWREGVMRVEQSVLFQKTLNVDNERTEKVGKVSMLESSRSKLQMHHQGGM